MLFKDGKWHDLRGIAEKRSLDELKVEMIVGFLSKYDFVELDKKAQKTKLHPLMLEFLNEIQRVREEGDY